MVAEIASPMLDHELSEVLELGEVADSTVVAFASADNPPARPRPPSRPTRTWSEVSVAETRAALREVVEHGSWRPVGDMTELDPLEVLGQVTSRFGFGGEHPMMGGLTARAVDELRPVARALAEAPAAARWRDPILPED